MEKPLIVVLGIVMALSLACGPGKREDSPSSPGTSTMEGPAEVHAAANVRLDALKSGDVEKYLSVYAEDAVWMPPASAMEIVGKEAARRRIKQTFETATLEPMIQSREQTVMSQDWIADRGQYSILVTPKNGGESKQDVGSFLTIWRRDTSGKWRIYFDIWNTNSPIVDLSQAN